MFLTIDKKKRIWIPSLIQEEQWISGYLIHYVAQFSLHGIAYFLNAHILVTDKGIHIAGPCVKEGFIAEFQSSSPKLIMLKSQCSPII